MLQNERHEKFAQLLVAKGLPATQAYAKAFNREADNTSKSNAHRLLTNADVAKRVEEIEVDMQKLYKKDAHEAYQVQKDLMKDKQSPANVRLLAAKDIQDRAGHGATQKVAQTSETKYTEELTDQFGRDERMQLLAAIGQIAQATGKTSEELETLTGFNELQWEETRVWNDVKQQWDYTTRLKQ